jgi:hypothetical protein
MRDGEIDPVGDPPNGADEGEALEDMISAMDRYVGADEHTTAAGQAEGDTIDERTRREHPQRERPDSSVDLVDDDGADGVDREKDLVADGEERPEGPVAPEQAAIHVRHEPPGAVNHPDDYARE